ncbi:dihydrodipicolinate synthase family protein [Pelagibius sp. Alg239-R121]|uniref:dihydrodipicolinate synthase family protein n=1 Tax=Pelagibius sp. Alg239-R121 TaxID=2993448 RepID=UPI0024A6DF81|nr:dihydrodipicolinate synthase family protein [Pelagibius sp. Alg239-R121]
MNERFGLSVALATPFQPSGEIADAALLAHARTCLEGGCDSVTLFGTTGEGASIAWEERCRLLGGFNEAGITGDRLVSGISATAVMDAVAQIKAAQSIGCKRVLLPPPYYFKQPEDEGVIAWYRAVFEQLDRGSVEIILYNIPSLTGVALSVDLIARLRDALGGSIIAVKDSTSDWDYTQTLLATHNDISILVGEERHLAAAVRKGGAGAICGMANLDPGSLRRMAWDGVEQPYINDLVELLSKHPLIPAIKTAIAQQSDEAAWSCVRAPLLKIEEEVAAQLQQELDLLKSRKAA